MKAADNGRRIDERVGAHGQLERFPCFGQAFFITTKCRFGEVTQQCLIDDADGFPFIGRQRADIKVLARMYTARTEQK
ncbi:MAG: hypothetical protein OER85_09255 [Gammaproteobacteria bacterium]|nr:hypothetical protein [Gammaproteobacteria bacterium]